MIGLNYRNRKLLAQARYNPARRSHHGPKRSQAAGHAHVPASRIPSADQSGAMRASRRQLAIAPIFCCEPSRWPISGWRGAAKRLTDIAIALLLLADVSRGSMLLLAWLIRLESPGPVAVPPASHRLRQCRLRHVEVPHDASSCAGTRQRSADHAARPRVTRRGRLAAALLAGRTAATVQRAARRDVDGRTATACARHLRRRQAVRTGDAALCRAPSRATGHDRPGAGPRLAWRDRHRGEAAAARRQPIWNTSTHWSLWLDLAILARTAVAILAMRNAY